VVYYTLYLIGKDQINRACSTDDPQIVGYIEFEIYYFD